MRYTIFSLTFALIASISDVFGCSNPRGWQIEHEIERAEAIFVGEVERVEIMRSWAWHNGSSYPLKAPIILEDLGLMYEPKIKVTFAVDKAWKGVRGDQITISTPWASSCRGDFQIARRYLVYAFRDDRDDLIAISVSSKPFRPPLKDLEILGTPASDFLTEKARQIQIQLSTQPVYREQ